MISLPKSAYVQLIQTDLSLIIKLSVLNLILPVHRNIFEMNESSRWQPQHYILSNKPLKCKMMQLGFRLFAPKALHGLFFLMYVCFVFFLRSTIIEAIRVPLTAIVQLINARWTKIHLPAWEKNNFRQLEFFPLPTDISKCFFVWDLTLLANLQFIYET